MQDRPEPAPDGALDGLLAVLFDLDGVVTPTAEVHMRAWRRLFEAFLEDRSTAPYTDEDYFQHIDGRPRYEGVAALLDSRSIALPLGDPSDAPDAETVCGLGNRKNAVFAEILRTEGVAPYPGSLLLLARLAAQGTPCAIVSSSRNAVAVLGAAGLGERFALVVDGQTAVAKGLAGKPAPDTYLYAARRLGVAPGRAAVIEDAVSGVAAGAAGEFGLVVGVDRGVGAGALLAAGADVVVTDLAELVAPAETPAESAESVEPGRG
ncbi:MAG: HAD-IA family hydrolase [Microbacteriaceae bacterium]|nr:HAD-IA family hydrolase [Microbacteriaceae bacterium]